MHLAKRVAFEIVGRKLYATLISLIFHTRKCLHAKK